MTDDQSLNRLVNFSGSAWAEYQKSGTMHDIVLPQGLKESSKFTPALFTPSTKAEIGDKDENIHPDKRSFNSPFRSSRVNLTINSFGQSRTYYLMVTLLSS
jgi:phosphoribosylaminoimidazole-succinocarboxamide synthase